MTDRVVVMYAGKVMESAPTTELFARPGQSVHEGAAAVGSRSDARGRGRSCIRFPACRPTSRISARLSVCAALRRGPRRSATRRSRRSSQLTPDHHSLCHFAERGLRLLDERCATAPLVSIQDLKVHFDLGGGMLGRCWRQPNAASSRRSTACRSTFFRARRSGWSANRAAARRRSAARCCGSSSRRAARDVPRRRHRAAVRRRAAPHAAAHADDLSGSYASLDPRMTVGQIIAEPIETFRLAAARTEARAHPRADEDGRPQRAVHQPVSARVLRRPAAAHRHRARAGGQSRFHRRRRADLGARRVDPGADLNLIERLQRERHLTYLFISHDLRAVRHTSRPGGGDVSREGRRARRGAAQLYAQPLMPYTKALISAVPVPDPAVEATAATDRARRRRAVADQSAVRLPLPHALSVCRRRPAARSSPRSSRFSRDHFAACIRISPDQPDIDRVAPGATPGIAAGGTIGTR